MCFSNSSVILYFFTSKKWSKTRSSIYYNSSQKRAKYFLSMLGTCSKGEGIGNDRLDMDLIIELQHQLKKTMSSLCHNWFFSHLIK